ncbi:PREDICTED: zinc transporter ZIP11 [Myotis brandtii]|uniref:zinc transporter ZIP11 n=1 Tax=Myotis brandtii TaxID=109478 RepID=UPI000703D22D|nr:PREDICTED: zinc transporter ZIP11 [Myotis brandtii]
MILIKTHSDPPHHGPTDPTPGARTSRELDAVSSMLRGHSAVFQALLGTLFTWGLTAAGAALVFIFSSGQRRILDGSLGFAAGVMLAASYWSLLAPAVEMATSSGGFGAFAFFPVAVGFTLGAAFVYLADVLMPQLGAAEDPHTALALNLDPAWMKKSDAESPRLLLPASELSIRIGGAGLLPDKSENGEAYQRKRAAAPDQPEGPAIPASALRGPWPRPAAAAGGGSRCSSWPSPSTTSQVRTGPPAGQALPKKLEASSPRPETHSQAGVLVVRSTLTMLEAATAWAFRLPAVKGSTSMM